MLFNQRKDYAILTTIVKADEIRCISSYNLWTDDISNCRADSHVYFHALMAFFKKLHHLIPVSIPISTLENGNVQFLFFCLCKCSKRGKHCCCAHSKDHNRSCKSFLHRLFPPSCWLLLRLPDDISIIKNRLVVNSQNNSLYGTFFCCFYIIWIFLRHICTIFFYLYFKWIILFFSCIINLSQSGTVMKIRTVFPSLPDHVRIIF